MVGFFKLKSDALADQVATGEAIMRVSKSAFSLLLVFVSPPGKAPPKVEDEPSYGGPQNVRFKVLLARYFMRHCR